MPTMTAKLDTNTKKAIAKGAELFEARANEITDLGGGLYHVPGQDHPWLVDLDENATRGFAHCRCPHFQFRLIALPEAGICKHIFCAEKYRAKQRAKSRKLAKRREASETLAWIASL